MEDNQASMDARLDKITAALETLATNSAGPSSQPLQTRSDLGGITTVTNNGERLSLALRFPWIKDISDRAMRGDLGPNDLRKLIDPKAKIVHGVPVHNDQDQMLLSTVEDGSLSVVKRTEPSPTRSTGSTKPSPGRTLLQSRGTCGWDIWSTAPATSLPPMPSSAP